MTEVAQETLVPFGFYPEMRAFHYQPITIKEERITLQESLDLITLSFLDYTLEIIF